MEIELSSINNPRKVNYTKRFQILHDSIKEKGVLNPIIVRPVGERFQLVDGAKRLEVCHMLGKASIPCAVYEMSEEEAFQYRRFHSDP